MLLFLKHQELFHYPVLFHYFTANITAVPLSVIVFFFFIIRSCQGLFFSIVLKFYYDASVQLSVQSNLSLIMGNSQLLLHQTQLFLHFFYSLSRILTKQQFEFQDQFYMKHFFHIFNFFIFLCCIPEECPSKIFQLMIHSSANFSLLFNTLSS